jgi:Zn-dependent peptidase ImmA (M78 family)
MILQANPVKTEIPSELIQRFQQSAPVDVVGLAQSLGVKVYESAGAPLRDGDSGMILRNAVVGGPSGYCIVVRATDAFVRKRFTVAHEVAHFILHREKIGESLSDDALYRSGLTTMQEVEANRLAAEILMPRNLVQHYIRIIGEASVSVLAKTFQVSESAMRIRLGLA